MTFDASVKESPLIVHLLRKFGKSFTESCYSRRVLLFESKNVIFLCDYKSLQNV